MSFCYKKILGVFTHLRVTTPNIIEPKAVRSMLLAAFFICYNQLIVSKPKLKKGTKGSFCSTGYPKNLQL